MYFLPKQIALILIIAACCFLTVSCTDNSRAAQCIKLNDAITQAYNFLVAERDSNDIATIKKLAKDLSQTSQELESLQLTDTNLKEFQSESVKSFQQIGQKFGEVGKALEAGNRASISIEGREQIRKAQADIIKAGQQANDATANQEAVTEKLIKYCRSDQ
jgi:predicted nuclease with TOPRIM domain